MVLGEPAEDAIVWLLRHPSAQIRKQSARNLQSSPFTTKRLADVLSQLAVTDPDNEVRAAAAATLQVMNRHLEAQTASEAKAGAKAFGR